MKPATISWVLCVGILCGSALPAPAQSGGYDLSHNVVAGGGATFSTGGNLSLGATAGQADAWSRSGGTLVLNAGFWSGVLSLPGAPCLLDVDNVGTPPADVATDIVHIARQLLGLTPVPPGFRALNPNLPSDAAIAANIAALSPGLDVDGNGQVDVATDVVYIARHLLVLSPVPASFRLLDATIATDSTIAAHCDALCPP